MTAEKAQRPFSAQPTDAARASEATLAASRAIEAVPPEDRGPMLRSMIENAIKRLEAALDAETAALRNGAGQADLETISGYKSLGLMELSRALQLLGNTRPDPATIRDIGRLNTKLEANRKVLKLHMEAVGEVVAIISETVREAESDGTYTLAFRSKGRAR